MKGVYRIKEQGGFYMPQKRFLFIFWYNISTYSEVTKARALKKINEHSRKVLYHPIVTDN